MTAVLRNEKSRHVPEALGQSEAFLKFQEQLSSVAPVDRPVLILGERGTGKELAVLRIHFLSKRWQQPFVTLNCGSLTPGLIGSELFGYEKGAFTGADTRSAGRFEKATGGTLFLDEIGNIPLEVQDKILRVVEYGSFERVGSSDPVEVDVRIVGATHADLLSMAGNGEFKQDLLDRLSFEVIFVPPLRERKGDIPLLARHFAAQMAFELGRSQIPRLSGRVLRQMEQYPWPGNIRELKNVVERAVYRSSSDDISEVLFDPFNHPYMKKSLPQPAGGRSAGSGEMDPVARILEKPFKEAMGHMERFLVTRALRGARYNQKQAARDMGLTYDQFRGLKRKHGIQRNE